MKKIEQPIMKADETKTTVTEEIAEFQAKKESPKKESKQLANVEEKYQEICNLQYVRSSEARKELMELIDALWKINDIVLSKTSNHDLSVRHKGRQIVKICPLKKGWSASVDGGKVQSYTKDQVLSGVRVMMTEPHKAIHEQEDKTVIKKLEERIAKMGKGSKGISTKGIKVTAEIKNWAKTKGYTLTGETLLVNRAVN
ncbi:MAG: hypothetical protein KAU84_03245 [Thermoplasmatales archaeon]|nr:hypothetical protein [Thermoplasmatales archaeon]